MKKLMIAAAIACVAVASQAATASWQASNVAEYGKTSLAAATTGYTGYLLDATVLSSAQILAVFADDTKTMAQKLESFNSALIADSKGTVGTPMAGNFSVQGAGSFGNSTPVTAYAIIFDASTIEGAEHVWATATQTKTTGTSGQAASFSFGSQAASKTAANWTTIKVASGDVPEPTSAMLILLGVAGLALRRKQK